MANALDISDRLALRMIATDPARARQRVAAAERSARADGNMARARLVADIAQRLPSLQGAKGQLVDLSI